MSQDINVFAGRLAEIGVITPKVAKGIATVMAKPCRDPQFPGLVEQLTDQVAEWHEIANGLDYTSNRDFVIIVENGVKMILKFAKANVSVPNIRLKSYEATATKLAKLDTQIRDIETELKLNPESATGIDIRRAATEMLDTYKTAISEIKSNETVAESIALLDKSAAKVEQISSLVAATVDITSKGAAKNQRQLFEAMNKWEADFAYNNYSENSMKMLDVALKAAQAWNAAPLSLKAKKATETEFYTIEKVGTRMKEFAGTHDAVTRFEQVIHLLDKGRRNVELSTDTTKLEERKTRNDSQRTTMENRKQELAYKAQTGQINPQVALAEVKQLAPMIAKLEKANLDLDKQIGVFNTRRLNRGLIIDNIEAVCNELLGYRNEPGTIVRAAAEINFHAMINFLEGSTDAESINDIVNLSALTKIIGKQIDLGSNALEEKMEEQDREFLENDPFYQEQTEDQTLSDEQAMAELLGLSGDGFGTDALVHPNTQYEENTQSSLNLNLSGLEN